MFMNPEDFLTNIWWESAVKNSEKIFRNSPELTHELTRKYSKVSTHAVRKKKATFVFEKKNLLDMFET